MLPPVGPASWDRSGETGQENRLVGRAFPIPAAPIIPSAFGHVLLVQRLNHAILAIDQAHVSTAIHAK